MGTRTHSLIGCVSLSLGSLFFLLWPSAVLAKALEDPVFGLQIDPGRLHFKALEPSVRRRCRLDNVPFWVFGEYQFGKAKYMIVAGTIRVPPDVVPQTNPIPPASPFDQGVALQLIGKQCEGGDPGGILLGKPVSGREDRAGKRHKVEWQIPPGAVIGLSKDVVRTHVSAFGGVEPFQRALRDARYKLQSAEPVLRRELVAAGVTIP